MVRLDLMSYAYLPDELREYVEERGQQVGDGEMQEKIVHSLYFNACTDQRNDDRTVAQNDKYEDEWENGDLEFGQRRVSVGLILICGVRSCCHQFGLIHVLVYGHVSQAGRSAAGAPRTRWGVCRHAHTINALSSGPEMAEWIHSVCRTDRVQPNSDHLSASVFVDYSMIPVGL